jgi:hypothetical protein
MSDDRSVCHGVESLCGIATTCKSRGLKRHAVQNWGPLSDNTAGLQFAGSGSPPQLWTFTTFVAYKNCYIKKNTRYTHGHYQSWPRTAHYASYYSAVAIAAAQSLQR